jgi:drug/metabolite transporter (DMT)-like permease
MRAQDVVRLLSLAALWGGSFAFIRVAAPALGPIWLAESRVALAFAALFAVAAIGRRVPSLAAHWREYLVIGTVNSALPFALFSFAEQTISASNAAITSKPSSWNPR